MSELFKNADEIALDLIEKLIVFRPSKRLSAEEALDHPFFKRFHDPEEEPLCVRSIEIPCDDHRKYAVKIYRDELYKFIKKRNKELRRERRM